MVVNNTSSFQIVSSCSKFLDTWKTSVSADISDFIAEYVFYNKVLVNIKFFETNINELDDNKKHALAGIIPKFSQIYLDTKTISVFKSHDKIEINFPHYINTLL